MSKAGGAGKVYFVLYLAVVLELLIIIVERDEAEEGLLRKQKETMRIVESILSQLQSGAGTEGINTRPQDEITITPAGINLKDVIGADVKSNRKYIVEVGVTDISDAIKKKEGETDKEHIQRIKKLIELGNVEEIEYQIFYNTSDNPNNAPLFISDEEIRKQKLDFTKYTPGQTIQAIDGSEWEFLGLRKLILDKEQTFNNLDLQNLKAENIHPVYPKSLELVIGPDFAPKEIPADSIFYYSESESGQMIGTRQSSELQKRAFMVNFEPPPKAGWYKLRFSSRTNRILGVRSDAKVDEMADETTVNIGTVQLTVKDLRKVQKELTGNLEKYRLPNFEEFAKTGLIEEFDANLQSAMQNAAQEDNATEILTKIRLYGYIAKLLAPGMSRNFDQNQGAIEFNIRVLTPHPTIAEPTVSVPDYNACFDKIAPVFEFEISPYQGEAANAVEGRIVDNNGATIARIECRPLDKIAGANVTPPVNGGKRFYRGYVDKELTPGKYKIEVTHKLAGKAKTDDQSVLEIFKTGLTEDSRKRLENRLSILTFYGYPISVDAEPTSGGKIKANQFRLYMSTNRNNQPSAIEGLSNADNPLKPTCQDDKVNIRITWVQPFTGAELDIYPQKSFDLKQEPPEIIIQPQVDYSGTAARLKVDVTGIDITKPISGCEGQNVEVEVKIGKLEKIEGLKTYDPPVEPTIEEDGTKYRVYFELTGKLSPGERKITGTVLIPISAIARNPNGKLSDEYNNDLTVRINWEPGQERRTGPRKPGR